MMSASSNYSSGVRQPLLVMSGIHKRFPGVKALDDMRLEVLGGEVHALVGENGAGKSTLMHILAGVYQPDAGRIDFAGRDDVQIFDEHAAQRMGIAIVYQERSLFEPLSVAENIFAGRQPVRLGNWIDRRKMEDESRRLLEQVELRVSPSSPLGTLSGAQQQLVEIAKALSLHARLIIFDEPTAALTEAETRTLFGVIGSLRMAGTAVIYISHRLEEILALANRVTILKDGRWQGMLPIAEATPQELIRRMVGRDLTPIRRTTVENLADPLDVRSRQSEQQRPWKTVVQKNVPSGEMGDGAQTSATPVLDVHGLTDKRGRNSGRVHLRNICFHVDAGEVVVLAGLSGAGRTETALSIFGARPFGSGKIQIDGHPVGIRNIRGAIAAGIGYLPEDRKQAGLFLTMGIAHNVAAANLSQFGSVWTQEYAVRSAAEEYRQKLKIACRDVRQPVQTLSGGNQQKVLLAKWLLVAPRVLIVDEPTRGVDVGAKAEVHQLLVELAEHGAAVLVISSDLPEVLALGDRVLVMAQGQIAGELSRAEANEERIMHLASGATFVY